GGRQALGGLRHPPGYLQRQPDHPRARPRARPQESEEFLRRHRAARGHPYPHPARPPDLADQAHPHQPQGDDLPHVARPRGHERAHHRRPGARIYSILAPALRPSRAVAAIPRSRRALATRPEFPRTAEGTRRMKEVFRKKIATHDDLADTGLHRCLRAGDLVMLGIGAIIGTGIFVLTGIAAATQAGPAVILSFVVAGIACSFDALAYAELAATVGGCGSAYGYSYAAFGELFAWLIGWTLLLEYSVAVAAVANGWSGYFHNALTAVGLQMPEALTLAPSQGGVINLAAFAIVF